MRRLPFAALVAIVVLGGCEARLSLGSPCALNTDCPVGLVCGLGARCRVACRESRDCAGNARCLRDPDTGTPSCSLSGDECMAGTCPRGLVCLEGDCVNACSRSDECPDGVCGSGACIPILEGTDGGSDSGPDALDGGSTIEPTDAGADAPSLPDAPDAATPDAPLLPPLRLVAPLSTSRVSDRTPTVRWALRAGIDGARLSFCADRACTALLDASDHPGSDRGEPGATLGPGAAFFFVEGTSGGAVVTERSSVWEIEIPRADGEVDVALSRFPDFDGDGLGDLAVGAGTTDAGSVLVWYVRNGSPAGRDPDQTLAPALPNALQFGRSVSAAGDLDGDGFGDLVVTSLGTSSAAHPGLYAFSGGPTGLDPTPSIVLSGTESFGWRALGLGDVDGDGYGDVAVGRLGSTTEVTVYAGSADGLTDSAIGTLRAHAGDVSFAETMAAGDFDGDGTADLAVSAWSNSFFEGRLYVYSGPDLREMRVVEPNPGARQSWAYSLAGLDADGDGRSDLAIAEPLAQRVYVMLGSAGGLVAAASPWITVAGGGYGNVLSAAGDLDGDGDEELLVGGPSERPSVVATTGAGAPIDYPVPLPSDCPASCGFGSALGALGDRDADQLDDVVIVGGTALQAHVFHGSTTVGSLRRRVGVLRTEPGFGRAVTGR